MPDTTAIDTAWDVYLDTLEGLVLATLRAEVWPLFKRRRYTMLSGNGTYFIRDRNGIWVERPSPGRSHNARSVSDNDGDMLRVFDVLDRELPGLRANCLGSLGFDYPEAPDADERKLAGAT